MSFQSKGFEAVAGIEPERALNIGVGMALTPVWAAFYASAGLGAAWWWSTAWTRGVPSFDVAALLKPEPTPPAEAYIEALDDAVCALIEAAEDVAEEKVEVVEAVSDSAGFVAETAVSEVEFTVEQVEAAVEPAEAILDEPVAAEAPAEITADPLEAAASEVVVEEPVAIEPAAQTPVVAEKPAFKPSKKKARRTQA